MRPLLLALLGIFVVLADAVAVSAKPNIVFFLVDDMGWQETSVPFHGAVTELNRRYHTPNMERLAAQGMKFIAGHCAGGPGSYWGEKNFSAAWRTEPPDTIWDVPGLEAYHGKDIHLTLSLIHISEPTRPY